MFEGDVTSMAHPQAPPEASAAGTRRFAEVVVTSAAPGPYHYRVPAHLTERVSIGTRVLVPLRAAKVTGVVVRDAVTPPAGIAIADISDVLDAGVPALTVELVELCTWIAEYYEAPLGEVLKGALPVGTAVASRVVVA